MTPDTPSQEAAMQDQTHDLEAALSLVREELDRLIRQAREEGAEAYRNGDRATFEQADARRQRLQDFADRFEALCREWQNTTARTRTRRRIGPSATPRARRGELVHEKEFLFPLLRALQDSGSGIHRDQVFSRLEREMGHRLSEADWGVLSDGMIRWRKRVAWLQNTLRNAGLITRGEQRGVWAITEEGRRELAAGDLEATWERVMQARRARLGIRG